MAKVVIFGGGFRGMASAFYQSRAGHDVALLERSRQLGGVLNCASWNGFQLDFGCHLLDNSSDETTTDLFEMAGGKAAFHPIEVKYASRCSLALCHGVAIPDLTYLDKNVQAEMLLEMVERASSEPMPSDDLISAIQRRFGGTASEYLIPMITKMFALQPSELASSVLEMGLFKRLRLLDETSARFLKRLPRLDDIIAVSSASNPLEFYPDSSAYPFRNFYPSFGGMGAFSKAVAAQLANLGVEVILEAEFGSVQSTSKGLEITLTSGRKITADRAISTLSPDVAERQFLGTNTIADRTHAVPMVLMYFALRPDHLTGMTYMHNFNEADLTFRNSAPGLYGKQINDDGLTYICAEIPTNVDGPVWSYSEDYVAQVFEEMRACGLVTDNAVFVDSHVIRARKSYSVAKVGQEAVIADVLGRLIQNTDRISFAGSMAFSKAAILAEMNE
jgi:protoporphyrinogen oxidase